jgi:hypothetical protein
VWRDGFPRSGCPETARTHPDGAPQRPQVEEVIGYLAVIGRLQAGCSPGRGRQAVRRRQVATTVSGLSDIEPIPCSTSQSARSGWSLGPWPQMPMYLPCRLQAAIGFAPTVFNPRVGAGEPIGPTHLPPRRRATARDSGLGADGFDERNPAVKRLLAEAIAACKRHGKYIGICGQGPSDHPDLADWLVEQGIGSMSLNPDTVVATWRRLTA